ncbi:UvrD-helicase domain-containing protein [uncultured Planktomarina sp.]|uniref:UvrD-helicase domain-containing protein n=1 Tax=uncultured Planktomarina sp. TaxID=1538529 RepID=UPI0032617CAA
MNEKVSKSEAVSFRREGFYRLLSFFSGQTKFKSVSFSDDHFSFHSKRVKFSIKYAKVEHVELRGIIFKKVAFNAGLQKLTFRGLSGKDADRLILMFQNSDSYSWLRIFKPHSDDVKLVVGWVDDVWARKYFQRSSVYNSRVKQALNLIDEIGARIPDLLKQSVEALQIAKINNFLKVSDSQREQNNKEYIPLELERQRTLFNNIEKNPLTDEQRTSVVTDEDANLVVAAAGSGKTSVIVAKAAWVVQKGLQRPEEILLLAFAADARKEMSERLEDRIRHAPKNSMKVHTFHSLGLDIIGKSTGKKPSLSKLADDKENVNLSNFIKDTILFNLNEDLYYEKINKWFGEFFAPYKSQFEFQNYGQYLTYLKENKIRSLKNEILKSYEECEIANFLYLNQINYIYEDKYKFETADENRRQYQPDFYLPDYGIYIEHLGLKGFGRTAQFINRKEYLRSLRWKRKLHQEYETTLIETYSCEKSLGILTSNLKVKLSQHGVEFRKMDADQVFEVLNQQKQIDPFTSLVTTFLGHFKGSQLNEEILRKRNVHFDEKEAARNSAFINVFMPIFESYQKHLKAEKTIDFHDMISQATGFIQEGKYKNPFKYIMVDEFQDISVGRSKLVSALQSSNDDAQLFCVGDDWQAIFRFAGSDINVMKEFGSYFGKFERTDLSLTFRSEEKITNQATNFILKNDAQIPKNVTSHRQIEAPSVFVHFKKQSNMETAFLDSQVHLSEILTSIQNDASEGENPEVLILGRYRLSTYQTDYIGILRELRNQFPGVNMQYKTAHRSKGLEADYVIIIEVVNDFLGFPNERADDHVLELVLAKAEAFPNSEERRLFYVALTRAKKKVFVSTTTGMTSEFVNELIQSPYDCEIRGKQSGALPSCPKCIGGRLALKTGEFGNFWGCNNHPLCNFTSNPCPHCKEGYPRSTPDMILECDVCEQPISACPRTGCDGHLQQENGPYGVFWGCSQFRYKGCDYKVKTLNTAKIQAKSTSYEAGSNQRDSKPSPDRGSPSRVKIEELRETYPNAYKPWSNQQENYLSELVRVGKSDLEISKTMGRQPTAIRSKIEKLAL